VTIIYDLYHMFIFERRWIVPKRHNK